MRQVKNKNSKDKVTAMIMLSFCLIALTSIFTIKASIDKVSQNAGDVLVTKETQTVKEVDEEEDSSDTTSKSTIDNDVQEAQTTTTEIPTVDSLTQESSANAYLCPMDMSIATVSKPYSMDMVIYNTTLDQYMVHPGIDIEGPTGSGVKAIADGTITDIYQDPAYGPTIEITHGDGTVSKYSNLESTDLVEKGDTVVAGQYLANIGQSALYESMEKCHLHFELYQNGEGIDPSQIISFQ